MCDSTLINFKILVFKENLEMTLHLRASLSEIREILFIVFVISFSYLAALFLAWSIDF